MAKRTVEAAAFAAALAAFAGCDTGGVYSIHGVEFSSSQEVPHARFVRLNEKTGEICYVNVGFDTTTRQPFDTYVCYNTREDIPVVWPGYRMPY